jgi:hypothetical protein
MTHGFAGNPIESIEERIHHRGTEAQRHREEEDRAANAFAFGSLNRFSSRLGDVPFRNSTLCLCG